MDGQEREKFVLDYVKEISFSAEKLAKSINETPCNEFIVLALYLKSRKQIEFLRWNKYHFPLLEALVARGGLGKVGVIRETIKESLNPLLERQDFELTRGGREIRWITRLGYTRKGMVEAGWMRDDSPHGIWEISSEGKELYIALKNYGKKLYLC